MAPDASDVYDRGDIFNHRELLKVGHVPDMKRIVGRDGEVKDVGSALAPATVGGPPETVIIYGKPGTGKSLVARSTTQGLYGQTREDITFAHSYVDCSHYQSDAKSSREMAVSLRNQLDADTNIPQTGLAPADYRDRMWQMLDGHDVDSFVVILDEIDMLDDDNELLRALSRAKESGKSDTHIGVICISNKVQYRERLNERVDSSLQDNELFFHPYNAPELRNILEARDDAFKPGVLEDGVIGKASALAAQEHGDARRAVTILYEAGRLAQKENSEMVTEAHVDAAQEQAEVNRFKELVSGTTPHAKYALHALATLTKNHSDSAFRTHRIYKTYETVCEKFNSESLSEDRVRRLLKEQAFLGITESNHTGGGDREGSYLVHRLMDKPEVVIDAVTAE